MKTPRQEAFRAVVLKKGPLGATCLCPYCNKFGVAMRRPYTWGDVAKAKAKVATHILETHKEETND